MGIDNATAGPGSPASLRGQNRARILAVLTSAGELSQADIARHTQLAPATVSAIVQELRADGAVAVSRGEGRRHLVKLTGAAGLFLGIDYGHRHVTVAIATDGRNILAEARSDFDREMSARDGIARIGEAVEAVVAEAGISRIDIVGAAMGLPAPIDAETGRVGSPTILPGWVGAPLDEMVPEGLGLDIPVRVDNDANLGALAEHLWGAGIGVDDLAYLKLSEGVGAGLILGGRRYAGPGGTAGEVGHVTVDEMGEVCRCGNRGCLETQVSARRVVSSLEPVHGKNLTITDIVRLADNGDRACGRVLGDVGLVAGRAIADLCSLLNPSMVVMGGELAQASDYILPAISQVVARCSVPAAGSRLQLRRAALGQRAHVLGAIAMAMEESSRHPIGRQR